MVNVIRHCPRQFESLTFAGVLAYLASGIWDLLARALRCFEVGRLAGPPLRGAVRMRKRLPDRAAPTGGAGDGYHIYLVAGLLSQMAGGSGIQPSGCHRARSPSAYAPPEGCAIGGCPKPFSRWEDTRQSDWAAYGVGGIMASLCPLAPQNILAAGRGVLPAVNAFFARFARARQNGGRFGRAGAALGRPHGWHEDQPRPGVSWQNERAECYIEKDVPANRRRWSR